MPLTENGNDLAEVRRVCVEAVEFVAAHGSLPSSEAMPLVRIIAQLCAEIERLRGTSP